MYEKIVNNFSPNEFSVRENQQQEYVFHLFCAGNSICNLY